MKKADILIKNGMILTMNENDEILKKSNIAIKGNEIVLISEKEVDAKKIIDASGKIVMPGLINAHTHASMTLLRGYADDYPLSVWLNDYIWPAEAKFMNEKTIKIGALLACAEMIESGTTFFNDMYFEEESVIAAAKEAGIKVCVGESFIDYPNSLYDIDNKFAYIESLFKKYKDDPLIKISVSPHAPYTCKADTLIKAKAIAKKYDSTFQIHLAETENERNIIPNGNGRSPVEYVNDLGLIDDEFVAFHCVHLSDNDRKTLKMHNAGVIHNPVSNYKLASGSAEIYKLLKMGIKVGLGTDGATSNNNLNMFKEMNMAALVQKIVAKNPAEMTAKEVVSMATKGSAKVLHIYDETGSIEVGKRADIIIVDPQNAHSVPMYDPYSYLAYSANSNDVETVIINGKPVYENKEFLTLDIKKIISDVENIAIKIKK